MNSGREKNSGDTRHAEAIIDAFKLRSESFCSLLFAL